jgi:hypothetical protein
VEALTDLAALPVRLAVNAAFVGRHDKDIEQELDALIPLLENGIVQEEDFNIRKKQLLNMLPKDSPIYQIYATDDQSIEVQLLLNGCIGDSMIKSP